MVSDLAPCDFWLFPEAKFPPRRQQFRTNNEVVKVVEVCCKELGKDGLKLVFLKVGRTLKKCIKIEGLLRKGTGRYTYFLCFTAFLSILFEQPMYDRP